MEQMKLRKWIGREVIEQSDGLRRRKGLRNQSYVDDYEEATRRQQQQQQEATGSRGEGNDETAPAEIAPGHHKPSPTIPVRRLVAPLWMEMALDREKEEKKRRDDEAFGEALVSYLKLKNERIHQRLKEEEHAESKSEEAEQDAE